MPPIIHCVRHAQGVHNLSLQNHQLLDPSLTRYGEEQCRNLARIFPYHNKIELLVSSPLVRCLQTTIISFDMEISSGQVILAHPDAQETLNVPCDTGKNPEDLMKFLSGKPVDLSLVHDGWNSKEGRYSESVDAVANRAKDLRQWLRDRPEKHIVLVTHGGFLHWFTEEWTKAERKAGTAEVGTSWANAEFRSYEFVGSSDNATLTETVASKKLRLGAVRPLSRGTMLELESRQDPNGRSKVNGGYHIRVKVSSLPRSPSPNARVNDDID